MRHNHRLSPRPPASFFATSTSAQRKTYDPRYKRYCFPPRTTPAPAHSRKLSEVGPAGPIAGPDPGESTVWKCSGSERVCLVLETTLLPSPGSRNAGWLRLAGAQHVRWGSPRNPPPASRVARGLRGRGHSVPGNRASLQLRSARPWGEGSHLPARQLQQLAQHS